MTKYFTWDHYFRHNRWNPAALCPPRQPSLTSLEKQILSRPLQRFQLGESSDGAGLMLRAEAYARAHGVPDLPNAIQSFIREEQRHSVVLGLFLDSESIPRIDEDWVDRAFRGLRNLAGLELMLTILATAELIAIPFYSAVRDASGSPVLRRIAEQILRDEVHHLEFQADNFALIVRDRGELGRLVTLLAHWVAMTCACLLVVTLHARLLDQARISPLRFWSMALEAHRPIFRRLVFPAGDPARAVRALTQ